MSEQRIVSVPTWGGGQLVMPEPNWCTGHPADVVTHPQDFAHTGAEIALIADTPRGQVRTLLAMIEQQPLRAIGERGADRPFAAVELDGDWYRYAPEGLRVLADQLSEYAEELRGLAMELVTLLDVVAEGERGVS